MVVKPESDSCANLDALLLDYAYGELEDASRRKLEDHLTGCPRCRTALMQVAEVRHAMAALTPEPAPEAGMESLLSYAAQAAAQRTAQKPAASALWRWLVPSLSAAGVAAVALTLVLKQGSPMRELAPAPSSTPAPALVAQVASGKALADEGLKKAEEKKAEMGARTPADLPVDRLEQKTPPSEEPKVAVMKAPMPVAPAVQAPPSPKPAKVALAEEAKGGFGKNQMHAAGPGAPEGQAGDDRLADKDGAGRGEAQKPNAPAKPSEPPPPPPAAAAVPMGLSVASPQPQPRPDTSSKGGGTATGSKTWVAEPRTQQGPLGKFDQAPAADDEATSRDASKATARKDKKEREGTKYATRNDFASNADPRLVANADLDATNAANEREAKKTAPKAEPAQAKEQAPQAQSAEELLALAEQQRSTGDLNAVEATWKRFLDRFPNHPKAPAIAKARVDLLVEMKRVQDATLARRELMEKWPNSPEAKAAPGASGPRNGVASPARAAPMEKRRAVDLEQVAPAAAH